MKLASCFRKLRHRIRKYLEVSFPRTTMLPMPAHHSRLSRFRAWGVLPQRDLLPPGEVAQHLQEQPPLPSEGGGSLPSVVRGMRTKACVPPVPQRTNGVGSWSQCSRLALVVENRLPPATKLKRVTGAAGLALLPLLGVLALALALVPLSVLVSLVSQIDEGTHLSELSAADVLHQPLSGPVVVIFSFAGAEMFCCQ